MDGLPWGEDVWVLSDSLLVHSARLWSIGGVRVGGCDAHQPEGVAQGRNVTKSKLRVFLLLLAVEAPQIAQLKEKNSPACLKAKAQLGSIGHQASA